MPADVVPLFNRKCSIDVDGLLVEGGAGGLRISFEVTKDLKKEPNRAHIKIYNFSQETREKLQGDGPQALRLLAGYEDQVETVFYGDIARVESFRHETEWVTEFSVGDGLKVLRGERVKVKDAVQVGGNAGIIKGLLANFGPSIGNLVQAFAGTDNEEDVKKHVLAGAISDNIHDLAAESGLSFSIQDGHPAFAKLSSLVDANIVNLSPATGLIGSPELTKKGYLKVKSLIQQKLTPGRGVLIDSQAVKGLYQIHRVKYEGDTHGDHWYADMELVQVTP